MNDDFDDFFYEGNEVNFEVGVLDNGDVVINCEEPVTLFSMSPVRAIELAQILMATAKKGLMISQGNFMFPQSNKKSDIEA